MSYPGRSSSYNDYEERGRKRERSPERTDYGRSQRAYGAGPADSRDRGGGGYGDRGSGGGSGYGGGGGGWNGGGGGGGTYGGGVSGGGDRYGGGGGGDRYGGGGGGDRYGGNGGSSYGGGGGGGYGGDRYGPSNSAGGGGRGGGGGFAGGGGRGGGRGGFGGRGNNKHMGESDAIFDLLRRSANRLGDEACLSVMYPPPNERNRDHLVEGRFQLPKLEKWRVTDTVGVQLDDPSSHIVRANFFHTPIKNIPKEIFHYNISIFRYADLKAAELQGSTAYESQHQRDDRSEGSQGSGSRTSKGSRRSSSKGPEDLAKGKDTIFTTKVMKYMLKQHPQWHELGLAYDSGSSLYTSERLQFPEEDTHPRPGRERERERDPASKDADLDYTSKSSGGFTDSPQYEYDIAWPGSNEVSLKVVVAPVSHIIPPIIDGKWMAGSVLGAATTMTPKELEVMDKRRRTAVMALDVALLCFARWRLADPSPQWIINGSKVFRTDGTVYDLSSKFVGMLGYYASLQSTLSGLSLVKDISVTCFMRGGNLVDFVCAAKNMQKDRLAADLERGRPLDCSDLEAVLKGTKIRTTHINQNKKFRDFGPPANHPDSTFTHQRFGQVTVAQYFQSMASVDPEQYRPLRFPSLPTVNVGSKKRQVLLPMEVVDIVPGQTRTRSMTGDISAQIIKYAAVLPNERFRNLSDKSSFFEALADDQDAEHFGLAQIGTNAAGGPLPLRVTATVLPPPRLQYGNQVIEPQLKGSWNFTNRATFAHPAPLHVPGSRYHGSSRDSSSPTRTGDGTYPYGAILVHDGREMDQQGRFDDLLQKLEAGSRQLGIPLRLISADSRGQQARPVHLLHSDQKKISQTLCNYKSDGARIVVVALVRENFYFEIKRFADEQCLPTQCCRMTTIKKFPRQYDTSLLIKMNMKMGGVNHTLASRAGGATIGVGGGSRAATGPGERGVFQSPPQSISWLFDLPTMVVGIDINHPENQPGGGGGSRNSPAIVAVVASMDGMLGQYCTHISAATATGTDIGTGAALTTAFAKLLAVFCERNEGAMPYHIICYRDGVADNQLASMLNTEYAAIREAVDLTGYTGDRVKISIIVCQKRHHTRLVYQATPETEYMNPCVGLVVDAQGSELTGAATDMDSEDPLGCIVGSNLNEFYLNSHAAVLGTSKPTKYILALDEIGFKMSELQLLTFWLTHLYCRCTRSVSLVTPAFYAHWAARRAKVLMNAGVDCRDLGSLSAAWIKADMPATMYFI